MALLGEGLWREQFGGDRTIIGRTISLDGAPYTVLGVLPGALRLPIDYASRASTQRWVPIALGPTDPQNRGSHGLFALGHLGPDIQFTQAQAEMDTITSGFRAHFANSRSRAAGIANGAAARAATFASVAAALIIVATLASYIPARRATRVDPMIALRGNGAQQVLGCRSRFDDNRGMAQGCLVHADVGSVRFDLTPVAGYLSDAPAPITITAVRGLPGRSPDAAPGLIA